MLFCLVGLAITAIPILALWWIDRTLEARRIKEMETRFNERTKKAVARGVALMRIHEQRLELQARLDRRRMELSTSKATGPTRRQGRL